MHIYTYLHMLPAPSFDGTGSTKVSPHGKMLNFLQAESQNHKRKYSSLADSSHGVLDINNTQNLVFFQVLLFFSFSLFSLFIFVLFSFFFTWLSLSVIFLCLSIFPSFYLHTSTFLPLNLPSPPPSPPLVFSSLNYPFLPSSCFSPFSQLRINLFCLCRSYVTTYSLTFLFFWTEKFCNVRFDLT
jgi:hypothetical protein